MIKLLALFGIVAPVLFILLVPPNSLTIILFLILLPLAWNWFWRFLWPYQPNWRAHLLYFHLPVFGSYLLFLTYQSILEWPLLLAGVLVMLVIELTLLAIGV